MDDTALGVTGSQIDIPTEIKRRTQQHEQRLYATRIKLTFQKRTWKILQWAWKEYISHLKTYQKY